MINVSLCDLSTESMSAGTGLFEITLSLDSVGLTNTIQSPSIVTFIIHYLSHIFHLDTYFVLGFNNFVRTSLQTEATIGIG